MMKIMAGKCSENDSCKDTNEEENGWVGRMRALVDSFIFNWGLNKPAVKWMSGLSVMIP